MKTPSERKPNCDHKLNIGKVQVGGGPGWPVYCERCGREFPTITALVEDAEAYKAALAATRAAK